MDYDILNKKINVLSDEIKQKNNKISVLDKELLQT